MISSCPLNSVVVENFVSQFTFIRVSTSVEKFGVANDTQTNTAHTSKRDNFFIGREKKQKTIIIDRW